MVSASPRLGVLLGLLLGSPCWSSAEELTVARQADLERLVIQDCGSCHGLKLTGGLGSPITPADLDGTPPEALREIILNGIPGTAMPPWRPLLSEADATWIANFLLQGTP